MNLVNVSRIFSNIFLFDCVSVWGFCCCVCFTCGRRCNFDIECTSSGNCLFLCLHVVIFWVSIVLCWRVVNLAILESIIWWIETNVWLCLHVFKISGWTHYFLSESESVGLLLVSSGCWCINLYVEGQCDSESGCGMCDIGLELLGCVSFHEFCREPKEKSSCTLPSFSHVCICWFSHHCHWLNASMLLISLFR